MPLVRNFVSQPSPSKGNLPGRLRLARRAGEKGFWQKKPTKFRARGNSYNTTLLTDPGLRCSQGVLPDSAVRRSPVRRFAELRTPNTELRTLLFAGCSSGFRTLLACPNTEYRIRGVKKNFSLSLDEFFHILLEPVHPLRLLQDVKQDGIS